MEKRTRFRCPYCGYFMTVDYSYCPTCGKLVKENAREKTSLFSLIWRGLAWFLMMSSLIAILVYLHYKR